MFDHLLESSRRDDSNNWPNIGFGEEVKQVVSIDVPEMQVYRGNKPTLSQYNGILTLRQLQ